MMIIGQTQVSYNRKTRKWAAQNGSLIGEFASEEGGKKAAVQTAVRHENNNVFTAVAQIINKHPELEAMAWRAGRLVINGSVLPPRPGNRVNEVARVKSQSREQAYSIQQRGKMLVCGCEWFQYKKAPLLPSGQRYCTHILAVGIANHSEGKRHE